MLAHPHESWVNSRSRVIIKFFFFSCQFRLENRESQLVEQGEEEDPYQAIALQRHLANLRFEIEWLKVN